MPPTRPRTECVTKAFFTYPNKLNVKHSLVCVCVCVSIFYLICLNNSLPVVVMMIVKIEMNSLISLIIFLFNIIGSARVLAVVQRLLPTFVGRHDSSTMEEMNLKMTSMASFGQAHVQSRVGQDILLSCDLEAGFAAYSPKQINQFRIQILQKQQQNCGQIGNCVLFAPNQLIGWSLSDNRIIQKSDRSCLVLNNFKVKSTGIYTCVYEINYLQHLKLCLLQRLSNAWTELKWECASRKVNNNGLCLAKYEFNVTLKEGQHDKEDERKSITMHEELQKNCLIIQNGKVMAADHDQRMTRLALILSFVVLLLLSIHFYRLNRQKYGLKRKEIKIKRQRRRQQTMKEAKPVEQTKESIKTKVQFVGQNQIIPSTKVVKFDVQDLDDDLDKLNKVITTTRRRRRRSKKKPNIDVDKQNESITNRLWSRLRIDPLIDDEQDQNSLQTQAKKSSPTHCWNQVGETAWRAFLNRQPRHMIQVRKQPFEQELRRKLSTLTSVLTTGEEKNRLEKKDKDRKQEQGDHMKTNLKDQSDVQPKTVNEIEIVKESNQQVCQPVTGLLSSQQQLIADMPLHTNRPKNGDHVDVRSGFKINIADQSEFKLSGAFHLTESQLELPIRIVFNTPRLMPIPNG